WILTHGFFKGSQKWPANEIDRAEAIEREYRERKKTGGSREEVTMSETFAEKFVKDPARMRLFQQERAIYEVTDLLDSLMREKGISRATLARRLKKSRGWVTQLLDGESNKTIRTVADVFAVLGQEYRSSYRPIQISNVSLPTISVNMVFSGNG